MAPSSSGLEWPVLTLARLARRDGGPRCWHCYEEVAIGVQHRAAKGMGGSRELERPSNGIALCNLFNSSLESDSELARFAESYGWKLSRTQNPAAVPVYDAVTGYWWQLLDAPILSPLARIRVA